MYRADVEAQSWSNNEIVCGLDALVTGRRSKCVSAIHQFTPLHSISISNINANVLIHINDTVLMQTD